MTDSEFAHSREPDLMLEHLMGRISRAHLKRFVQSCWQRFAAYLPEKHNYTVVDQFLEIADSLSDHDAAIYASEAANKAAGLAPDRRNEQMHQAALLRHIHWGIESGTRFEMSASLRKMNENADEASEPR